MNQPMSQIELEGLAEKLERLSVQYIQDKNWIALEQMLDPACQFVGMNGACDRQSAMTLMKAMNLSEPESFAWIQKTAMDRRISMKQVAQAVISPESALDR